MMPGIHRARWFLAAQAFLIAAGLSPLHASAEETCRNVTGKPVTAGTRWCRGGDFWVCQKDGTWFNSHASCVGGNRGHDHKINRNMKKHG